MGLFDRFRQKPGESEGGDKSFFLDADKSSSLGDVDFMRRSNTIRRTFPGTAENPGMKERIEEVASMEAQMAKVSEGLPEAGGNQSVARVDPGVPKPVKKTFAQPMSQQELKERPSRGWSGPQMDSCWEQFTRTGPGLTITTAWLVLFRGWAGPC